MALHISENANPQELYMIELQGNLTCSSGVFDSKQLGKIALNDNGNPELSIGNRILEGKLITLDKPISVLTKTDTFTNFQGSTHFRSRELEIKGIIRKKYIFSTRPRIISEASGA